MKTIEIVNGLMPKTGETFNGTYSTNGYRVVYGKDVNVHRVGVIDVEGSKKVRYVKVNATDYKMFNDGVQMDLRPLNPPKAKAKKTEVAKKESAKMEIQAAATVTNINDAPKPKSTTVLPLAAIDVPTVSPLFEKGTNYKTIHSIVKSEMFMPILVTGPSGNGKTFTVQQACANAKRKMIRVQISPETDEDSLIGGMRLIDGNTVFEKGPVINAMEQGAVLLIDEIDRGSNKIMCLQGIMEGSPFVIKRTGETITPAPGFTIVATGNTKGNGSDDGSFSAATVIDDAFLERFSGVVEQGWPTVGQETKILNKHVTEYGIEANDETTLMINRLVRWAHSIRSSYSQGGIESVISTRRLAHILKTYSVLNDMDLSINLACSKFNADDKEAMLSALELITGHEE